MTESSSETTDPHTAAIRALPEVAPEARLAAREAELVARALEEFVARCRQTRDYLRQRPRSSALDRREANTWDVVVTQLLALRSEVRTRGADGGQR